MRYTVRVSYVDILGGIWWPMGAVCSLRKSLSAYDIENIKAYGDGQITHEAVEHWVCLNSGDFSEIIDFSGSIEDGDHTIDFAWSSEETEAQYLDTLGGDEE